jgi:uncharacterized protein YicC (UPF0701 family)
VSLIPDDIWNKGPEAVAEEIARIDSQWVSEQLPQADKLSFDIDRAQFESTPIPLEADRLVQTTLKQVEFAQEVAMSSNCGLNASSTACLYIDQTLEHCRDDPNAIEQNFEIARSDLIDGIADGRYFEDGKLSALVRVLDRAVTDLRAHHPEVAEAWEARIKHNLRNVSAAQKQLVVEKTNDLIGVSSDKLAKELTLDASTIATAGEAAQSGAIRRFFGRVAQMRILLQSSEIIQRIDGSSAYKALLIIQALQSLISTATGLF